MTYDYTASIEYMVQPPDHKANPTDRYRIVKIIELLRHIQKGAPLPSYGDFEDYEEAVAETVRLNIGVTPL